MSTRVDENYDFLPSSLLGFEMFTDRQVAFQPSVYELTVPIRISEDTLQQGDREFRLNYRSPPSSQFDVRGNVRIYIQDNEAYPELDLTPGERDTMWCGTPICSKCQTSLFHNSTTHAHTHV